MRSSIKNDAFIKGCLEEVYNNKARKQNNLITEIRGDGWNVLAFWDEYADNPKKQSYQKYHGTYRPHKMETNDRVYLKA